MINYHLEGSHPMQARRAGGAPHGSVTWPRTRNGSTSTTYYIVLAERPGEHAAVPDEKDDAKVPAQKVMDLC
jgi:hypothetical protein